MAKDKQQVETESENAELTQMMNERKKIEEDLKKAQTEKQTEEQKKQETREFKQIKSRILQQFVSPTTGFKGIVSKEEEQMIEDQAKMVLRKRKRDRENKSEKVTTG